MKLLSHFSIVILTFFLFFHCSKKNDNTGEYAKLLKEHPATDSINYPNTKNNWIDRVYNVDDSRISYLNKMNKIDGFEEVPIASTSMDEMKNKIDVISKSFHPQVQSIFNRYIFAIYFCENLGGTGVSGFVYDNSTNRPKGGFIVIDSKVIQQKANDWISYKEKSVFTISGMELEIKIENENENTVANALRYILLHEMGHILSNTLGISPDLRNPKLNYSDFPFFNKVWISMEESNYDKKEFPLRSSVVFYASKEKALNLETNWNRIYPILQKTNFPTLYGATNALDHFAETFVSYVHCIIDERPWELTLKKNGKVIYKMKNRIHEMEREKEVIRKILSN